MKIFDETNSNFADKVNFVDKNNVFVGYDLSQSCCESAGWFINEKECDNVESQKDFDLQEYIFDTSYFKEVQNAREFDEGGLVLFKLTAENKPSLFLHIYNSHNGYYGHGFESKIGDVSWKNGVL